MPPRRPLAITLICIMEFVTTLIMIGLALLILLFTSPKESLVWSTFYLAAMGIAGFLNALDLWKMNRRAVIVYTLLLFCDYGYLGFSGERNVLAFVMPLLPLALVWWYYRSMQNNDSSHTR